MNVVYCRETGTLLPLELVAAKLQDVARLVPPLCIGVELRAVSSTFKDLYEQLSYL